MENTKIEVAVVEAAICEAMEAQLRDLNELQLALVGGGCGDTILA